MMDHIRVQEQHGKESEFDYKSIILAYKYNGRRKKCGGVAFPQLSYGSRSTNVTSALLCQRAADRTGEYQQALPDCALDPAAWAPGSTRSVRARRDQKGRLGGRSLWGCASQG